MTIKIVKLNAAQGTQPSGNDQQVSNTRAETVDTQTIVGEMHRLGQSTQIDPVQQVKSKAKLDQKQKYLSAEYDIKNGITADKDNICKRIELPDGRRFVIYQNDTEDGIDYNRVEITPGKTRTLIKRDAILYKTLEEASNAGNVEHPIESVLIHNKSGEVLTYYDCVGDKTDFFSLLEQIELDTADFEYVPGITYEE